MKRPRRTQAVGKSKRPARPARPASALPVAPDLTPTSSPPARFPVVGIGASAGGLAALEEFLRNLSAAPGAAFLVVTHQHADHASLLPELLARCTHLPVLAMHDHMRIQPNVVHVAPPRCLVQLEDEQILLVSTGSGDLRPSIDHFFRSLAQSMRDRAVAIVLSGSGSDGSLGIAAIKAVCGVVLAQEPSSAQYPGMPASAIASQLVDFVLPPEKMPERLALCAGSMRGLPAAEAKEPSGDDNEALLRILVTLHRHCGNDFSAYKKSTIWRRLQRRMNLHGIRSAQGYAEFLLRTPHELDALSKELLISVTSFFRDPDAFTTFEAELEKLVLHKPHGAPLRGWIAGCATGEEAYSHAILLREAMQHAAKDDLQVQLFATDLDPQSIDFARGGRYLDGIEADVSAERRKRFFSKEPGGYRVRKDIRELLVFAVQSVFKDPPFTRLDFISCRNVLIYLEPKLQKRVLGLFAYSLLPSGLLFLGSSESISGFEDRFAPLDKRHKLFARRDNPRLLSLPHLPAELSLSPGSRSTAPARAAVPARAGMAAVAERTLMESFAPPSAIVNERGELIYVHGRTGHFLEPAPGEPSSNLFSMAREGLRLELPAAIREAAAQQQPVVRRRLRVKTDATWSSVMLTVRRLTEPEVLRGTFLVSFETEPERESSKQGAAKAKGVQKARKGGTHLARLEEELQRTRESLQGTIEELETSNEELKSTNEELQSANEELETSREEMQALNEELQTVNSELEERNQALTRTNDDMQNLLNSTDIATVFLDDKLTIKRFTTQAKKVFSLIEAAVGRPMADLVAHLRYTRLVEDASEVLRTLVPREAELQTNQGQWRSMRITPYRTHDNLIDGLVLTFIDIDRSKCAEQAAQQARAYAESIVEAVDVVDKALLVLDSSLHVVSANRAFHETFQTAAKLQVGAPFEALDDGRWNLRPLVDELRRVSNEGHTILDYRLRRAAAGEAPRLFSLRARPLPGDAEVAAMVLITIAALADRKAEPALEKRPAGA